MLERSAVLTATLFLAACGIVGLSGSSSEHDRAAFDELPEVAVCVVDRSSSSGLREISARRADDGTTLILADGRVVPLDSVHAPGVVAGYAAAEPWFASDSISFRSAASVKVQGERRIEADQVTRIDDYRGIPVFAGVADQSPYDAVYLPTRAGCVFQAYVRSDLM